MSPRLRDIFVTARSLRGTERAAYLESVCGQDTALRSEVESLLASDARGDLDTNDLELALAHGVRDAFRELPIPERIGSYRILARVAVGGMGVVFEAVQDNPERTVALKVVNAAALSPGMLDRFETEVRALGNLQHRGIAQIFEAGSFDIHGTRLPYFAMEYIRGMPLTDYAEHHHLDLVGRLNLMALVCDAVDHAHRKHVIHRDLKPGNIFVNERGQPKILDFGVARFTAADLRDSRHRTRAGQLVGTLPYMSPEQVTGSTDALDARSDLYSLGVVTYELLAGKLPYEVSNESLSDAISTICHKDPEPLAAHGREMRGDVESMVSKALEKDPGRRYASPAEFAGDLRRFLRNEPIRARRPSTAYQLRKFARRNRVWFASGATLLFVIISSLVIMSRLYVRSEVERRAKEEEAARATAVSSFLLDDMLAAARPVESGYDTKVVDVLDRAAEKAGDRFAGQPLLEAEVRLVVAETYQELGKYQEARDQSLRAASIFNRELGKDSSRAIQCDLIGSMSMDYLGNTAEAEAMARSAYERARDTAGDRALLTASTAARVGELLQKQGKHDEAEALLRHSIDVFRADDTSAVDEIEPLLSLAASLQARRRSEESAVLLREALSRSERVLGSESPSSLSAKNNLIGALLNLGENEEAADLATSLATDFATVYGPDHPLNFYVGVTCARALEAAHRDEEAMSYATKAYDVALAAFGPSRFETEQAAATCKRIAQDSQRASAYERWAYIAFGLRLRVAGPGELESVVSSIQEIESLPDFEPESFHRRIQEMADDTVPRGSERRARFYGNLGRALWALDRADAAEPYLTTAIEAVDASDNPDEDGTAIREALVELYESRGELAAADRLRSAPGAN